MKPPLAAFTLLALPRMEQVESSWTGERRSPAPGENMAAPLPTGERGLQALQSGPGLIVHGVPTLADELSHHVPLLPHHVALFFVLFLTVGHLLHRARGAALCLALILGFVSTGLFSNSCLLKRHCVLQLWAADLPLNKFSHKDTQLRTEMRTNQF